LKLHLDPIGTDTLKEVRVVIPTCLS